MRERVNAKLKDHHVGRRALSLLLTVAVLMVMPVVRAGADYGSGSLGAPGPRTYTGNMATADVALFGDSIAQRGTVDLTTALTKRGRTIATDNQAGRATPAAVDAVLATLKAKGKLPRVVIMAVGTNDIFNPPVMTAQIKRLRAAVPPGTTVLWVDVQAVRVKQTAAVQLADQRNSAWVNIQIREQCTSPCRVVPWSWWFASSPSRLGPTGYLIDGVHPKAGTGTAFWAAVVMNVLAGAL